MGQFTTTVADGAIASGTAKQTLLSSVKVPNHAVELISVKSGIIVTQGDPAESVFCKLGLEGTDLNIGPIEWYNEISPAKLGAVDQISHKAGREWFTYAPVTPNSSFNVFCEPLDSIGNAGEGYVDFKWSTVPTANPTINSKASTEVSSSTSTGPDIELSNAALLVGYGGGYTASTVAADDGSLARLSLNCPVMEVETLSFHYNPIHTIEATSGVANTELTTINLDDPLRILNHQTAKFTSSISVDTALSNAGAYGFYLRYIPYRSPK